MTTAIPVTTTAPISEYSGLVAAIIRKTGDQIDESGAKEAIWLAERRFNRVLTNLEMETTTTWTAAASTTLPADYKGVRSVYLGNNPLDLLPQLSPDDLRARWPHQTTGRPQNYTLIGDQFILGPSPDSAYTVNFTYLRGLTPLTDANTSNWLLETQADLYLYAALLHAEFDGWNDDRLGIIKSFVDDTIVELNSFDARRRRGDLVAPVEVDYF